MDDLRTIFFRWCLLCFLNDAMQCNAYAYACFAVGKLCFFGISWGFFGGQEESLSDLRLVFLMGPRGRGPCWRWELEDADSCRFPGAREEQVMHV